MRNGNNGPTKISRSWESRGVYSGKRPLQLLAVVLASLLIVSSALAGELGALCSAAKNFVSAATTQEGILITYPTANELAASTMAYAAAKKRYLSEFRSAMPILIAIGLKQRPETAEIEEFRSAFRLLDGEEEQRVAKATVEMLKGFGKTKLSQLLRKSSHMLKNLKQILSKTLMDSIRPKEAYKHYMDSAFRTHTGVGNDAQIKTNADQKRQLPNWKPEWEKRLTGAIDPDQRGAYKNLQGLILRDLFSREEKPFQVFYQVSTQRAVHLKFHD